MVPAIVVFLITFTFLLISIITKFFPAKDPSHVLGLRTVKTLSSPEKWEEGNKLFGDYIFKFFLVNTMLVILLYRSLGPCSFLVLFTAISFSVLLVLAVKITDKKL